jgi:DNA-directed RNA polymerase specialized sigma24 family protein
MNPRQAVMVESRFFGGLDIPETAALLNVSEATVLRDWRAAKAWLARELRQAY